MRNALLALLTRGVRTSEFWLSLLAIALPALADLGSDKVAAWTAAHGWVGGLVAAVYVAARAYVKGKALTAAPELMPAAELVPLSGGAE